MQTVCFEKSLFSSRIISFAHIPPEYWDNSLSFGKGIIPLQFRMNIRLVVSEGLSGSEKKKPKFFYCILFFTFITLNYGWYLAICSLSACLVLKQKYKNGIYFEVLVKIKIAIYCPQGSGTLRQQSLMMHWLCIECQSMPEYARVCQSMPEYARVC